MERDPEIVNLLKATEQNTHGAGTPTGPTSMANQGSNKEQTPCYGSSHIPSLLLRAASADATPTCYQCQAQCSPSLSRGWGGSPGAFSGHQLPWLLEPLSSGLQEMSCCHWRNASWTTGHPRPFPPATQNAMPRESFIPCSTNKILHTEVDDQVISQGLPAPHPQIDTTEQVQHTLCSPASPSPKAQEGRHPLHPREPQSDRQD